jgi:dihydrofolate synthase/folylpolyglutamate synthase
MSDHKPSNQYIADQFSYLEGLTVRGIRSDLSVMREALTLLDHPEDKVRTVIVGGTNGKGSTAAMIGGIVRHAEYSVGCYFSPHILDVRERIVFNGRLISIRDMAELIGYVRSKTERLIDLTYFEFLTLSAYFLFSEKKADLGVMEVGMGGRFDATNVTEPLVSVITTVSLDHTRYLGNSRKKIAVEKVQIVPEGGVLVAGRVDSGVKGVLREHVRERGGDAFFLDEDFSGTVKAGGGPRDVVTMDYQGIAADYDDILVPVAGSHQADNAAVALAVIEILGKKEFSVSETAVRRGIASVRLPGRMERIGTDPEVIVDVAHNPAGARALACYIQSLPKKKTAVVVGIMGDKDIRGFLEELVETADVMILAPPHVQRAASLHALEEAAESLERPVRVSESISGAVAVGKEAAGIDGRVVITGSFYTVQEAMRDTIDTS